MELVFSQVDFLNSTLYNNITFLFLIKICIASIICFIFKYFIDKFIIFNDKEKDGYKNFLKSTIYFFSILNTFIFWITEFLFKIFFNTIFFEIIGAIMVIQ